VAPGGQSRVEGPVGRSDWRSLVLFGRAVWGASLAKLEDALSLSVRVQLDNDRAARMQSWQRAGQAKSAADC